jgi:hypothetical protein
MFVALCCNKAKEGIHLATFRFEKSCSDWGERPQAQKSPSAKEPKYKEIKEKKIQDK